MEDLFNDCRALGIKAVRSGFEDYLQDESRFRGFASGLVRVRDESEVINLVGMAAGRNVPLTVASGRTSLTGAPVPIGGLIVDVTGLDTVDPKDPSRVGPGIIVKRYKEVVEGHGLFYPPDPTSEESCTLGGNTACNASGARSYLYGPTRDHIRGLRVLLPTGAVLEIERGDVISSGGGFDVPREKVSPSGPGVLSIPVPRIKTPQWSVCKNAAGLFSSDPMDLVDLFIGSEGILGIILNVRTALLPPPKPFFALMLYMPSLDLTVELVRLLDGLKRLFHDGETGYAEEVGTRMKRLFPDGIAATPERFASIGPACMEWMGVPVARFLSEKRRRRLEGRFGCLYVEQEYREGTDPLEAASQWAELVQTVNRSARGKSGEILTEVAMDEMQIRKMREDRRAVPEKLGESIRPGMVKVGTDFAVPMEHLRSMMELCEDTPDDVESYAFGHIGNAHLHVNMLPGDGDELQRCRSLCLEMARKICDLGGSVSAEHGIGKLKHRFLEVMIGAAGIEEIRKVKRALDPQNILNRGNMIAAE